MHAVRASPGSDQVLEAGDVDTDLHVHPRAAYASGDLPKWVYGIVQTLVNKPGPQSNLYLKKGLQYGTTVPEMLWVFSEGAWETLLATVKIMNAIPYSKLTRRESLPGSRPSKARPSSGRRMSPAARCRRQSLPPAATRPTSTSTWARVEAHGELAEAARGEVDVRTEDDGEAVAGPAGSAND